jgi:hypothetical protein
VEFGTSDWMIDLSPFSLSSSDPQNLCKFSTSVKVTEN